MTRGRRDLLVLGLLALFVVLPGLGNRALWNPDEPRYAEVAREMRLSGEWFVPHLNGEIYAQKPPLLMWLMNASSLVAPPFGSAELNEWSARLPSALSAAAAVLLTFLITRRLASRRAAWLAAVAFGTCMKILWQGRTGQIDMLLTALVALAVWFWVRGYTERRPGFYRLFFLTTGFATLAKGPVGLLPPLLSVVAFLLLSGEREEIRRMRIGTGLLLWAGVVLAWLVPAGFEAGRPYLETIVFKQNVTRYADPWHHFRPPWYYLTVIPVDFFPWSLLLPGALVVGWRRLLRGAPDPDDPADRAGSGRRAFLFGLSWMVVTLVFFSVSPAKRTVYILTMYPAMALLVGMALDRWAEAWNRPGEADRGWLLWPLGLLAALAVAVPAAAPFVAAYRAEDLEPMGPGLVPRAVAVFSLLALGAVAALWLAVRGR
ncbi:MAG: glycosyltransferase family 39 protein, partial [Acidobacteriota bacterium]